MFLIRSIFSFLTLFILIIPFPGEANPYQLSQEAKISLITCGPWQGELYSAFGHSAIRVSDSGLGIDWSFNYGTFDFNQPNFYLNFARGRNFYMLSVQEYPAFRDYYIRNNRYIHEQELNLDSADRQQLFDYLWNNALPENRSYRYDYFYNNCSTKPRDVVESVFGERVRFNDFSIPKPVTIRQLTDLYLVHQPWGDLGIDICLGLPMDKIANTRIHHFLPDYLEVGFDHATINNGSAEKPLVKEKRIIFQAEPESNPFTITHPLVIFSLLLALIIGVSGYDLRKFELSRWLDLILFNTTGLLGLLLVLMWFATDHQAAAWNFNLLWAMPINLALPFMRSVKLRSSYFIFMTILTLVVLVSWPYLPQELNLMLFPVVLGLLFRYYINFRLLSRVKIEHS